MKTLAATLLGLSLITASATCLANPVNANSTVKQSMPVYEFVYSNSIDIVAKNTAHTLQQLNYQRVIEIQHQARNNIEYIGARLQQNTMPLASVPTDESVFIAAK